MHPVRTAEAPERDAAGWWAAGVSLAIHGLLLLALELLGSPLAVALPQPAIGVEVISAAAFAALTSAAAPVRVPESPELLPPATAPAAAAPPAAPRAVPAAEMTVATSFYARDILDDPANARVRRTLPLLAPATRIAQLCAIEGLEQLRLARPGEVPDALVAYALAETSVEGLVLDAPGAAFRSDGRWYAVRLTCEAGPDFESVTDFRFAIGEPVPEDRWAALGLLAADRDE